LYDNQRITLKLVVGGYLFLVDLIYKEKPRTALVEEDLQTAKLQTARKAQTTTKNETASKRYYCLPCDFKWIRNFSGLLGCPGCPGCHSHLYAKDLGIV